MNRFTHLATLLLAALLIAPIALAQGAVSTAADLSPTGGIQVAEFQPLPAPIPENTECYNNGPLANSTGTSPFGGDESVLVDDENLFGWGAQISADNTIADDYVAEDGCTDLKGAVFYMYQSFVTDAPSITGANVDVYGSDASGNPDKGDVVCSTSTLAGPAEFTDTYRVTAVGGDNARRLQRIEVDFAGGCSLTEGERYWFAIQAEGTSTSGPWQPPVPRELGSTGCPGPTNGMGAMQSLAGAAFAPAFTDAISCQGDMPFALLGADGGGGTVTDVVTVTPNVDIPDGIYDGSLASMACTDLDFGASTITNITDVVLTTGIDHTWIGDLTLKVVDPEGDVLTVMSRPGFAEPADDGSGCCGASANLSSAFPVAFADAYTDPAEDMGNTLTTDGIVCSDDGRCEYEPSPDSGPGVSFADFNGQAAAGVWQVCAGDSFDADTGTLAEATLAITGETDTPPGCLQELTATLDDDTPAPGQVVTFAVTVVNNDASPAPLDLWLIHTGPKDRTVRLAGGTVPGSSSLSRDVRVRVPSDYATGNYNVNLHIGDFATLNVCDTANFSVDVGGTARVATVTEVKAEVAHRVGTPSRPDPVGTFEVLDDFFAGATVTALTPSVSASAPAGSAVAVAPNPFAHQTTIAYAVEAPADVRLAVYDVLGREVAVLVDGEVEAGTHRATFDASGLAAGTYIYRLSAGGDVQTGRMTLAY